MRDPSSSLSIDKELRKGSAELLILAILEDRPRHGYEVGKLIDQRSDGLLRFHTASLYPTLYRLETRGLIAGRWVEKEGVRRRRYYRLTAAGRRVLARTRSGWEQFIAALTRVARLQKT